LREPYSLSHPYTEREIQLRSLLLLRLYLVVSGMTNGFCPPPEWREKRVSSITAKAGIHSGGVQVRNPTLRKVRSGDLIKINPNMSFFLTCEKKRYVVQSLHALVRTFSETDWVY
jgi:hypothetical protein